MSESESEKVNFEEDGDDDIPLTDEEKEQLNSQKILEEVENRENLNNFRISDLQQEEEDDGSSSDTTLAEMARKFRKNKYTLIRNMRQYFQDEGVVGIFDNWTQKLITDTERNCLVLQSNQCTSRNRLDLLFKVIQEDKNPEQDNVRLFEVLQLVHDKTSNYRSKYGFNIGSLRGEKPEKKQEIMRKINALSREYVNDIKTILQWSIKDRNISVLLPDEDIPEDVKNAVQSNYPDNVVEQKRILFLIRKSLIESNIMKITELKPKDILSTPESIVSYAEIAYLQDPSIKAKLSWEKRRYNVESHLHYQTHYKMIRVREEIDRMISSGIAKFSSIEQAIDWARATYRNKQLELADTFKNYINDFGNQLSVLYGSKIIPNPFAQSTYLVDAKKIQLCNTFMWPDRMMNTLRFIRSEGKLVPKLIVQDPFSGEIQLYRQIIADQFDPWAWFTWRNQKESKILSYISGAEQTDPFTVVGALYDVKLLKGSDRLPNKSLIGLEVSQGRQKKILDFFKKRYDPVTSEPLETHPSIIYTDKYLRKVLRGLNIPFNENEQPYREGDYVYDGQIASDVENILLSPEASKNISGNVNPQDAEDIYRSRTSRELIPSEYTVYSENITGDILLSPEASKNISGNVNPQDAEDIYRSRTSRELIPSEYTVYSENITGDINIGSFVQYRYDVHPSVIPSTIPNDIRVKCAGHAYYFKMRAAKMTPHIWFKDTLSLGKRSEGKSKKKNDDNPMKKRKLLDEFQSWITKVVQIDAICENPGKKSDGTLMFDSRTFPEWMLLMFKVISGIIYSKQNVDPKLGVPESQEYLIMIPLDRLYMKGGIYENIFVYFMRRYLQFGLCVNEVIIGSNDGNVLPLYKGNDEEYDYDYVLSNMSIYYGKMNQKEDGSLEIINFIEEVDESQPYLIRPVPTSDELWKLWQFYTQDISAEIFKLQSIDIESFLANDIHLNTSRMRYIKRAASGAKDPSQPESTESTRAGKKKNPDYFKKEFTNANIQRLREVEGLVINPLEPDIEEMVAGEEQGSNVPQE